MFAENRLNATDAKSDVAKAIVERVSSLNESKSGNSQSTTNISHSIGSLNEKDPILDQQKQPEKKSVSFLEDNTKNDQGAVQSDVQQNGIQQQQPKYQQQSQQQPLQQNQLLTQGQVITASLQERQYQQLMKEQEPHLQSSKVRTRKDLTKQLLEIQQQINPQGNQILHPKVGVSVQQTLLDRLNPIVEDKHQSNIQVSLSDSNHVHSHDGIVQDIIIGEVYDPKQCQVVQHGQQQQLKVNDLQATAINKNPFKKPHSSDSEQISKGSRSTGSQQTPSIMRGTQSQISDISRPEQLPKPQRVNQNQVNAIKLRQDVGSQQVKLKQDKVSAMQRIKQEDAARRQQLKESMQSSVKSSDSQGKRTNSPQKEQSVSAQPRKDFEDEINDILTQEVGGQQQQQQLAVSQSVQQSPMVNVLQVRKQKLEPSTSEKLSAEVQENFDGSPNHDLQVQGKDYVSQTRKIPVTPEVIQKLEKLTTYGQPIQRPVSKQQESDKIKQHVLQQLGNDDSSAVQVEELIRSENFEHILDSQSIDVDQKVKLLVEGISRNVRNQAVLKNLPLRQDPSSSLNMNSQDDHLRDDSSTQQNEVRQMYNPLVASSITTFNEDEKRRMDEVNQLIQHQKVERIINQQQDENNLDSKPDSHVFEDDVRILELQNPIQDDYKNQMINQQQQQQQYNQIPVLSQQFSTGQSRPLEGSPLYQEQNNSATQASPFQKTQNLQNVLQTLNETDTLLGVQKPNGKDSILSSNHDEVKEMLNDTNGYLNGFQQPNQSQQLNQQQVLDDVVFNATTQMLNRNSGNYEPPKQQYSSIHNSQLPGVSPLTHESFQEQQSQDLIKSQTPQTDVTDISQSDQQKQRVSQQMSQTESQPVIEYQQQSKDNSQLPNQQLPHQQQYNTYVNPKQEFSSTDVSSDLATKQNYYVNRSLTNPLPQDSKIEVSGKQDQSYDQALFDNTAMRSQAAQNTVGLPPSDFARTQAEVPAPQNTAEMLSYLRQKMQQEADSFSEPPELSDDKVDTRQLINYQQKKLNDQSQSSQLPKPVKDSQSYGSASLQTASGVPASSAVDQSGTAFSQMDFSQYLNRIKKESREIQDKLSQISEMTDHSQIEGYYHNVPKLVQDVQSQQNKQQQLNNSEFIEQQRQLLQRLQQEHSQTSSVSQNAFNRSNLPPKPHSAMEDMHMNDNISSLDTDPESFIEGQEEEQSMRTRFEEIRAGMRDLENQLGSSLKSSDDQ